VYVVEYPRLAEGSRTAELVAELHETLDGTS
jgi:hypothetical protein